MKRSIVLLSLLAISITSAYALQSTETETQAKTKIEQFSAKTGVVLIRGFEKIGTAQGLYNTSVNIETKEFTNVNDSSKQYGITIEAFKEAGTYDKKNTSFIDFDEIESLIQGIDYITKVTVDVTKLENFQADYTTKGALKISTFSSSDKLMAAVTSGNVAAYFNIEDLAEVKFLLLKAKQKIELIKQ